MPSPLDRLLKRLRGAKTPKDGSLLAQRKRALTLPLPPQTQQETADQLDSAFFTKLPPEVRRLIYLELLYGGTDVIHVTKKPRKPLEMVRCRDRCSMEYNYKCSAGEWVNIIAPPIKPRDGSEGGLLPLLQSCRRIYSEVIDELYGFYLFDFRSFDAFLVLSTTMLPQRWQSIQKIHLKWHFGYSLWPSHHPNHHNKGHTIWKEVWHTMSLMHGLREIDIDLDAYLDSDTLSPADEAEIYQPMMAVTVAPMFLVNVAWDPRVKTSETETRPFRLQRPPKRKEAVMRMGGASRADAFPASCERIVI